MAMNPPNIPPTPLLLGPGGQPIQTASNFQCPVCKHRPPVTDNPQFPPGTPMAMLTAAPGENQPTINCLMCWNKFWAKFVRRHAPELRPLVDGVQYTEETDPDEEVE